MSNQKQKRFGELTMHYSKCASGYAHMPRSYYNRDVAELRNEEFVSGDIHLFNDSDFVDLGSVKEIRGSLYVMGCENADLEALQRVRVTGTKEIKFAVKRALHMGCAVGALPNGRSK